MKNNSSCWSLSRNSRDVLVAILFLFFFLFSIESCKRNPKYVDVSNIKLETQTLRFDKDFYSLTKENAADYLPMMKKKYGDFFEFFIDNPHFLGYNFAQLDSTNALTDSLLSYVNNPFVKMITDTVQKKFTDISSIEKQMNDALKHVKYYFPNSNLTKFIPVFIPAVDGTHAFTYEDNIISVNLFYYLGANCIFYEKGAEPEPKYLSWKYKPDFIVADCMSAAAQLFNASKRDAKCIDKIIFNGKIAYFASCMMPDAPDSLIIGFTQKQIDFCNTYEDKIFQFYIEHKLLYSVDELEYGKFLKPGPGTTDMPAEAPGNTGSWLGYRIVSKFMKENPNVTLQQLMAMTDGQKIMEGAKYKP